MTDRALIVVTGGRGYADREAMYAALDRIRAGMDVMWVFTGACGMSWSHTIDVDAAGRATFDKMHGADRLACDWARSLPDDVGVAIFMADWNKAGPCKGHDHSAAAAGPCRNAYMISSALETRDVERRAGRYLRLICVVAPGGDGTADCAARAKAASFEMIHVRGTQADLFGG